MAKLLKLRRGTTSQHNTFTGAEGEVTIDTTKDTAVVHDGAQAGGRPLAREDMSNVSSSSIAGRLGADSIATTKIAGGALPTDVTVTNANVVSNAAIAGTKISPDFGGQTIATTGQLNVGGNVSFGSELNLMGSENNKYLDINLGANTFNLRGTSGGDGSHVIMMTIQRNGATTVRHAGSTKLATQSGGVAVTGNIVVSGTVDGRDVAADGTKLDGIESGATGDQTAAEIRTLVESASDSNVFTNADHTKLNGIESGATADQTAAEIRALVASASDSQVFTDADHSKLNGIESGATADQSASEILTLIKTVDGSGSGLDADTLDGVSSGSFVRNNNGNQSIAGNLTVGTGTNSYIYMVDSDEGNRSIHNNSNRIGFLTQTNSWGAYCDDSGNWVASGNVTAYSDARLKTDISTINDALGIVGKLRGVSYKWLRDGSDGIGVIAQEVEEVLPSVVVTTEKPGLDGMEEVKSVDYGKIVGVLINAINELKAELDEHKKGGK